MEKIGLLIVGLFLSTLALSPTSSPELISSGGDSFINTSYQLDWSIGECATATHSVGNYVITQGFHQSTYEITAVKELTKIGININVYPNPTTDFITVNIAGDLTGFQNLSGLMVTDINGKILLQEKITSIEQQIDFSSFKYGVYFLCIKQENQLIKTFKIIKN